jgi:hypothetical protein
MVVGGTTQYLTKVQEMPEQVTKKLTDMIWNFVWEGNAKSAPINRDMMHAQLLEGGKKILDLSARNDAIQLTWLQSYMKTTDRPTWTYYADALFRLAAPSSGREVDEVAAVNPIVQNWRPKTAKGTTLPKELISLIRTAEKHGVKMEGIEMGENVRREAPIWFHNEESTYMRKITNRPTAKCMRNSHKVRRTGQMAELARREENHANSASCNCQGCSECRREGCRNPLACREMAGKIIDSLPPQWRPAPPQNEVDMTLSEDEVKQNDIALAKGEDVTFERILTVKETSDAIRVFTPKNGKEYRQPEPAIRGTDQQPIRTAWTISKSKPCGEDASRTMAAVWFGQGDNRNTTFQVKGPKPSRQRGDIMAIAEALRRAPKDQPLRIISQNRQIVEYMTTKMKNMENKGWINVKHGDILRSAASWAKSRTAKTYFCAKKIARDGKPEAEIYEVLDNHPEENVEAIANIENATGYEVEGAKLADLSQSELYRHILEAKRKDVSRGQTERMINKIKIDLRGTPGGMPETEKIWKSVRSRDFSRAQRNFKWRAIHGAYKVGAYWDKIPNYENRGKCPVCGECESIEHILLKCISPTRKAIKEAEKELWKKRTNIPLPAENLGSRLGAGLIQFGNKKGDGGSKGLDRFWRIIQSETDQVIWTLRCEARIARGDRPEERHSIPEALNRWQSAIERRLKLERLITDGKRFGKIAVDRTLVAETWHGVVSHNHIGDAWIEQGGVLVGRHPHRSQVRDG